MDAFDAAEIAIPVQDSRGNTPAPTPIKPGGPLSVRITSVFLGEREHGRSALLTSAVRSPLQQAAAPLAVHYLYQPAQYGEVLTSKAHLPGSDVIYYSAGEIRSSLDVSVQLSFDSFDRSTYDSWIDAAATAAQLPVFAVSGPTGAAWIAVAKGAAKFITREVDRAVDGANDRVMTWRLNLADPGFGLVEPGYVMLYPDDNVLIEPLHADGEGFARDGDQFVAIDGTLRWQSDPSAQVREGDPYVLAYVNGASIPEIGEWSAAAVSAELSQKFFNADSVGADDVLEAFKAYNDVTWLRRVDEFDEELTTLKKEPTTPERVAEIAAVMAKRQAAVRNLRDETVRNLVKSK